MKELLKKIGINQSGYFSKDGDYIIDLENADEYNRVFSKLDKSSDVEENEDASVVNMTMSNILYDNDDYSINLIADFDNDIYKIVVHELRGDN